MKTILFTVLFLFVSFFSFGQETQTKEEWTKSFKLAVCYNGFLSGLADVELSKRIASIDRSTYNPVFNALHQQAISKASDYLIALIRKDDKERDGRVAEGAAGKRVMLICFDFYSSTTLDSIASKEYKNWMKDPERAKKLKEANNRF